MGQRGDHSYVGITSSKGRARRRIRPAFNDDNCELSRGTIHISTGRPSTISPTGEGSPPPRGKTVRLEPANARLQPIDIPADEVEIRGVVRGLVRRFQGNVLYFGSRAWG